VAARDAFPVLATSLWESARANKQDARGLTSAAKNASTRRGGEPPGTGRGEDIPCGS
jgi:hypothetical protein